MRFLYGRIFLFVFPLTSFQWLVHYRHIHMNKYKSKKQKQSKQSKLSLSQDLKYLKMLQGAGSHFQISPEGKKAMYSQSLKCLSVCVLLRMRTSSRCCPLWAWGQICAAVLVVGAGWNVHSRVGDGSTTWVFDAAQQAEVERGSDLFNSQQLAWSKGGRAATNNRLKEN